MAKRKRSGRIVPEAPPAADSTSPAPPSVEPAPADRTCPACALVLPAHARFCAACGEPLLPGLMRPAPLEPQIETPRAAQATVPSVARVTLPRSRGAAAVPTLSTERPIPASLLSTGEEGGVTDPLISPRVPARASILPSRPPLGLRAAAPSGAGSSAGTLAPGAGQQPIEPAPLPPLAGLPPRPAALFDINTEARLSMLRADHQRNLELLSRLARAVAPKPVKAKPAAKKAEAKADAKADKKADKKAEKKADKKAAKGH